MYGKDHHLKCCACLVVKYGYKAGNRRLVLSVVVDIGCLAPPCASSRGMDGPISIGKVAPTRDHTQFIPFIINKYISNQKIHLSSHAVSCHTHDATRLLWNDADIK
jgi:hypothetical protein